MFPVPAAWLRLDDGGDGGGQVSNLHVSPGSGESTNICFPKLVGPLGFLSRPHAEQLRWPLRWRYSPQCGCLYQILWRCQTRFFYQQRYRGDGFNNELSIQDSRMSALLAARSDTLRDCSLNDKLPQQPDGPAQIRAPSRDPLSDMAPPTKQASTSMAGPDPTRQQPNVGRHQVPNRQPNVGWHQVAPCSFSVVGSHREPIFDFPGVH